MMQDGSPRELLVRDGPYPGRRGASENPHVTVCVPVRNGARTIQRTLDSILAQDYPNFDVIVSDNCSDDATAAIVRRYADRRVTYLLNPTPAVWGEANWNFVLAHAPGPLIALYHADDLYAPTMISRQAAFLTEHVDVSSVFTLAQRIDELDRPIRMGATRLPAELRGRQCLDFPDLFNAVLRYGNFLTVPTLMTRRTTLDSTGLFNHDKFCTAADIDLWLRMGRWGPVGIIEEPLHRYRISPFQGSAQMDRTREFPAHFFTVMDHYLSTDDIRVIARQDALLGYEMQRTVDDILRAMHMVERGDRATALSVLERALSRPAFREGLWKPSFSRAFVLGALLYAAVRLNLGNIAGSVYSRIYKPWTDRIRLQPVAERKEWSIGANRRD